MRVISVALMFILLAAGGGSARALHRPPDEADGGPVTERLHSIDRRVPNSATGTVRLHLGRKQHNLSLLEVNAHIRSLPVDIGRVYRLWVVDDFVSNGILLKTFRADKNGDADVRAARRIRDLWQFRRLVVTIESPRLRRRAGSFTHGPTVMEGVQPLEGE